MHRPRSRRRTLWLVLLAALVVLALAACGGGSQGGGGGGAQDSAESEKGNPLVGTWRRERTCEELVSRMKEAGLAELIPEFSPSEFAHVSSARSLGPPEDPCRGVKDGNLPHDHVFYENGTFASVDDQGEFVDDGTYEFVDERTIEFADPPGNLVRFRFGDDFDTVTFDVTIPDMDECSKDCRMETAYRLAVFYPGLPWKRVPEKDKWPGEE
jgi:hypothetical protein